MQEAFLFPGQGVVPSDICEYYTFLKGIDNGKVEQFLQIAQDSLDEINPQEKFSLQSILSDETSAAFKKTSCVQVITFALSCITNELYKEKNTDANPICMLGHSLGGVSALVASNVVSFEDGCRVITARGKCMQEASEKLDTGMIVVLGLLEDQTRDICQKTTTEIALMNAPTAFVIGGEKKYLQDVEKKAMEKGASKTIRLDVSGAFHTKFMQEARIQLETFLSRITFQKPSSPLISNILGKPTTDPGEIKNDIVESITSPINWTRMVECVKKEQVTKYIEMGPGTSLSSLCRINGVPRENIFHAQSLLLV